jgi:hypothetical protein
MAPNKSSVNKGEALLQTIRGVRLTSVQFVLDYVILGFDSKGALTALVWPEIHDGVTTLKFGMTGYRDRLCELIPKVVRSVEISEDETIFITFEGGTLIRIPLRDRKVSGERAIFTAPKHHLYVW